MQSFIMLQMTTSDIAALITVIILVISGAIGIGMRWAKSQSKADQSQEKLKIHKKDCKEEFDRVKDRLDVLEAQRTGRHKKSGDIINELAQLIRDNKKRGRSSTESDDGDN